MARLTGAQRMVLQAIFDLPKGPADDVSDAQIAQATRIALEDVRDWLETLEGDGHVDLARTTAGLSVSITARGKLALGQFRPFSPAPPGPDAPRPSVARPPLEETSTPTPTPTAGVGPTAPRRPIRLFLSYSHKDEVLRKELEDHLSLLRRQGFISAWNDRMIGAGDEWRGQLDRNLEEAQVILLLITPSFLASDYCWDVETKRALERHDRGETKVIPVLLRPVDWEGAPFAGLQGLPVDMRPVTTWPDRDEAWTAVAKGIRRAVEAMGRD